MAKNLIIREYDSKRDLDAVEKLERSCEIGYKRGFSIITSMMGDPTCRIKFYPLHVMLVAEMVGNQKVVGVIRGCIKNVGTGLGAGYVMMGCILGLRVSPKHRRIGIGSALVDSVERWAIKNGAQYLFLAAERSNIASINLFVLKFHYKHLRSLTIIIHPVSSRSRKNNPSPNIKIQKLTVEEAISLYNDRLGRDRLFPSDIEAILKKELSLGTWISYFDDNQPNGLLSNEDHPDIRKKLPRSWVIVSMWKTFETHKLQIEGTPVAKCFSSTLTYLRLNFLPCLKMHSSNEFLSRQFGFMLLYGLYGEGEKLGDLVKSLWCFASNMTRKIVDCKAIVTELGAGDPLREHIPSSFTSCINDLWLTKRVNYNSYETDENCLLADDQVCSYAFVDPRDF